MKPRVVLLFLLAVLLMTAAQRRFERRPFASGFQAEAAVVNAKSAEIDRVAGDTLGYCLEVLPLKPLADATNPVTIHVPAATFDRVQPGDLIQVERTGSGLKLIEP